MQSSRNRTSAGLAMFFWGLLPLFGLCAELGTGLLSTELPVFPTLGWTAAVVVAVFANLALHVDADRQSLPLTASALLHAFVLGMAALYGLAELPALPLMLMLLLIGFGALAAAPYWTLLGMIRLLPRLSRRWREARRSPAHLVLLLLVGGTAPLAISLYTVVENNDVHDCMQDLAAGLRHGSPERQEQLAARLRRLDLQSQLRLARTGTLLERPWIEGDLLHIADGRPFWFVRRLSRDSLSQRDAADAFYCAHGRSALAPQSGGRDRQARSGSLRWQRSTFEARVEPAAGIARVDWLLEVHATSNAMQEARFDLRLPYGAVASSLSMWIGGEERPAAFASRNAVTQAYERVVATRRDPALLTETGPGQLRLLVFPVTRRLPPATVRVSFTVPIATAGDHGLLSLPDVALHNCSGGAPSHHEVSVVTGTERTSLRAPTDRPPAEIRTRPPAATAHTEDADGFLAQTLRATPRTDRRADRPLFVVVEASASVGRLVADLATLFEALPAGTRCSVFAARGGNRFDRIDGDVGSAAFAAALARIPCRGGCDPTDALQAAFAAAKEANARRVVWLHGSVPRRLAQSALVLPEHVRVEAFALASGENLLLQDLQLASRTDRMWGGAVTPRQASEVIARTTPAHGEGLRVGDTERVFVRPSTTPTESVEVSDQLARLWAAWRARALARSGAPEDAGRLATRYRIATAGVGAVVLETEKQYEESGLDPGAKIGREPEGVVGGGPVPEPTTILLVGSGLLALLWARGRRTRSLPAA